MGFRVWGYLEFRIILGLYGDNGYLRASGSVRRPRGGEIMKA